jgi:cardiolipin synthase (CMP-forming)
MAVATDGGKPRPARPGEREVNAVLNRSSVNAANCITVARLLMVVPLIWLITTGRLEAAFWLLVVAGVSDAADGFIAKRFDLRTELGAYLDPLADKALLVAIYVAFALSGTLPVWLVTLVVSRDVLIVVGVVLIQRRHPTFRATPLVIGKINTFAQILLAGAALAHAGGLVDLGEMINPLIVMVACTTLLSAAGYAVQAYRATRREAAS